MAKSNLLRILNFVDFIHVCNILKCKYTHKRKLSDLIPSYKVNLTRFSHDPNKVISNFSSYALTEDEKSFLCKELRFCIPRKKIEYADILTKFESLYRDTILFEIRNSRFSKKETERYLFLHFEIV